MSLLAHSQKLSVQISGIRNNQGTLQLSIFKNAKQFDDEKPEKMLRFDKNGIVNGKKTIVIDLPPGTYGITILDDEDNSDTMTYKLLVYPKEGVGFSNFELKGLQKPDFTDFDFTVSPNNSSVNVVIKYF